jgi:hypothetical protein
MSSLSRKQCGQPITFDNKHISQRTGKKIPLDIDTDEPHDCPALRNGQQQQQLQQQGQLNQGDTTNVTKAAARKSILMQITRAKAANGFR